MAKYILTNKAVEDLTEIWNYTFDNWSENQADHYYQMLPDSCQEIAENKIYGKNYEGIIKDLLGISAGRHIIFYRKVSSKSFEIIRILHDQMDLKNRILEK